MARLYAKLFSFLAYCIRLLDRNSAVRMLKTFCNPTEVAAKLKEIGNLETQVTTEANVCQGTIAESAFQNMDENSRDTRQKLRDMSSSFDGQMEQLWKHLNEDERCKILQWVSDIPYESDHYIARKGRVEGTGEWLMGHEVYQTWQRPDTSNLMWLNGIPGAGKTKLSSRVVDDLLARLPKEAEENTGFAYFYCDRNRPDHSEPVAIMRSIIRQLCAPRDNRSIESCVEHQYLRRKVKGFSSDRLVAEECKQLLMQLVAGYKSVYIVVDGLDECDRGTRHMLMDLLDEFIIKFQRTVKVYIASRTDQDLRKRYNDGTHLEVTANDNQADIEKFVLSKMDQSEFCRTKLSRKLRDKILSTFQEKSQGMFQWATLHIGELIQLERNADIAKYLDGLPKGLEAAYDKIYGQISDLTGSKKSIAFAAFQIVMVSQRPLHPFELAIAAAQHSDRNFILDQDVDIEYVLEACQNLLVVADGSQERDVTAVPTADPDLQGYLKQEVKATHTSGSMANTDVLDDPNRIYATGKSALRPYTTPVLGCVMLGIHEVLDEWLSKSEVDPNGRNIQGDSLLDLAVRSFNTDVSHEAVKTGNADIVKAIIDGAKSASYHGQPLRLEKALNEAAQACRPDLAAILLSYGDNQDGQRQVMIHNALNHVPANDSGIGIMKVLMGLLKDRNHKLLHSAVKDGNWTFVEALTEMGVDVTMKTKIFGSETTDHEQDGDQDENANDTSRVEAIRYLLQHGAHTDTIDKNGMTLLGIACAHAFVTPEVIEMLLEHGANVNATQGHGEVSMSPLDILYLHYKPSATEILPSEDDNLAAGRLYQREPVKNITGSAKRRRQKRNQQRRRKWRVLSQVYP
ncbi:hypothetical protein FGSG_11438 [Fusarium graminearum PH-1]|uniref:hypothetical protein n=1 Tax=Gibberella zeae (strain ATCC MYA-4620 / CBS 123657 / FGSC 9075 / NRRL 31084 / PH-1) TaxID=229533 RepID=UPI00021F25FE|nr:hypothetical protein FGSG_11438 [Fusarium graminearum PH-1]ESU18163.1 hypothetical protein FGSG_11438 [Fusarium graminearum PH-1]|eukprot:XP_011325785.1 hypothetical protein FGSG_11438 [Fusarium graminearum PH-1]